MMPFAFNEPPTLLLYPAAPQQAAAQNIVTIGFGLADGTAGVLVPLFIGDEPAKRFIASLGPQGAGMKLIHMQDLKSLEILLVDLKKNGTTHVNFNAERDNPNPISIDEVIDSLRNRS